MQVYCSTGNGVLQVEKAKRPIRIMDLLTMTSGLTYEGVATPTEQETKKVMDSLEAKGGYTVREFCYAISKVPLAFHPGTHWHYGYSHDVVGGLIEVLSGKSFGQFLNEEVFTPLGIKNTFFFLNKENEENLTHLYTPTISGLIENKEYEHMSIINPAILTLGSINIDLILSMERLPVAGENLFGKDYLYVPGGKGANQAVAASLLGANVVFVGKVGDDINGKSLIRELHKKGITTEYIYLDKTVPTGLAAIVLESMSQNRIIVYPGANMSITENEVIRAFERSYDALLLQLEIPEQTVISACSLAKAKNIPVIVDAGPAQDFPLEKIKGIEILSPNETETYAMCGIKPNNYQNAVEAAKILKKRSGAKFVVIKLGDKGALLFSDSHCELIPSIPVEVIDPTAAGDAFIAALTIEYLRSGNIVKAVQYGNIVGAISVTKLGAQPSLPTIFEVEEFIENRELMNNT